MSPASSSVDLLIFGASRHTGLEVSKLAVAQGLRVAAMVSPQGDVAALETLGVAISKGDAMCEKDCWQAVRHFAPKTVLSTLGGKTPTGVRIDGDANIHVLRACEARGDGQHLIMVTSMGCDEQYDSLPTPWQQALGAALQAKTKAEKAVRASKLNWVIVRPTGLTNEPATGRFRLQLDGKADHSGNYLARADLAIALLEIIDRDDLIRQAVTVLPA